LHIALIRQLTNTPIAAGFGIADFASAAAALEEADGFVVGSAFVNLMEKQSAPTTCKLLAETIDPRKKINP
jgi:tryptophan synthase alpha chain